jgi:Dual-action HEIGH metallo-peptidase
MKRFIILCTCLSLAFFSCKKNAEDGSGSNTQVPASVLDELQRQGYSIENVVVSKGGYVVEGDIFISNKDLVNIPSSTILRVAETEQYHTTNLLATPKTIPIGLDPTTFNISNLSQTLLNDYSAAITSAINEYNLLGLNLTLAQGDGKGGLVFTIDNTDIPGLYALGPGFPNASGGLASGPILVNTNLIGSSPNPAFLTWVIAHEVGHCIGFRHTDYLNSTPSCGYNKGEVAAPAGAILISGTPTTDPNSWMVTCLDPSRGNPFDANDLIALKYLMGCPVPVGTISGISFNINTDVLSWNALAGATGYTVKITAAPPLMNPSPVGLTFNTSATSITNFFPFSGYAAKWGTYSLTVTPNNSCGMGTPASYTGTLGIAP